MESILSSKLFTTRRGTIILGVSAAVLAAIVLLVYLKQYRHSVNSGAAPVSVLVAKSLIQQGTPGDVVGSSALFQTASIPKDQVKSGAFVDPTSLHGQVAATDIFPGQQLTSADFTTANPNALTQKLGVDQRAIAVSITGSNAVAGQLAAGNKVDIWVSFNAQKASGVTTPIVRQVLQNVTILSVGGGSNGIGSTSSGGTVTFKVNPADSGRLIYASQNGTLYLVLRPTNGKPAGRPLQVNAQSLLGQAPIIVGGK